MTTLYFNYENSDMEYEHVGNTSLNIITLNQSLHIAEDDIGLILARNIPLGFVLFSLCLVTAGGNIAVLHAVKTEKKLQTVSNNFLAVFFFNQNFLLSFHTR